jgi:hypothetical protein
MSDELLGTNPETPATASATATEVAIAATEARLAELNAKKVAEDAIKATSTFRDREAAVALHATFCPAGGKLDLGHLSLACPWHAAANADSPGLADWTEEQHRRWLAIAVVGPVKLRALGWVITPPSDP